MVALSYQCLSQFPEVFRHFTGVSLSEFAYLYQKLVPVYQRRERERLSQHPRQRSLGGGRKYGLSLQDRLLMTLVWLHLYPELEALGSLFDVHKSTASRNTGRILACLQELGEEELGWPPEPPSQKRSLEVVLANVPDGPREALARDRETR